MDNFLRSKPTVTFGLVTYKQEEFAEEAVRSALDQTYEPLEILICDDSSPDRTFDVARAVIQRTPQKHSVRLFRNERRIGIDNFNKLLSLATGELIVIAHGDDVSSPERVERIVQAWQASGASMVTSNALKIDSQGRPLGDAFPRGKIPCNSLVDIAANGWNPTLWGAVLAIHREVFEVFGPLNSDQSAMTTDWILPFRAAALRGISYIDEQLVRIREHSGQKSRQVTRTSSVLEKTESWAASELIQYLYMLDDLLLVVKPRQLQPPEILEQTSAALSASILRVASRWRRARNHLLLQNYSQVDR
jgi:glycosyltransferase involved in cell wall biosynthesis